MFEMYDNFLKMMSTTAGKLGTFCFFSAMAVLLFYISASVSRKLDWRVFILGVLGVFWTGLIILSTAFFISNNMRPPFSDAFFDAYSPIWLAGSIWVAIPFLICKKAFWADYGEEISKACDTKWYNIYKYTDGREEKERNYGREFGDLFFALIVFPIMIIAIVGFLAPLMYLIMFIKIYFAMILCMDTNWNERLAYLLATILVACLITFLFVGGAAHTIIVH